MSEILKAKPVVKEIYTKIVEDVSHFEKPPILALVLIGEDPAAAWYVNNLVKQGKKRGIEIRLHKYNSDITQNELMEIITAFNQDDDISGIMLQKPLPSHINEEFVSSLISPQKDVDGFHPENLGKLLLDQDALLPCTPQAVLEIIKFYEIQTSGKHVVVLGRSDIVGKPLANLLLRKSPVGNATVTVCHSRTKNINEFTLKADILISAIGRAGFVTADMVTEDTVVIDVGTNLVTDEKGKESYCGDVDFEQVEAKVKAITPVPGGVGSVTTSLLLRNVVTAAKNLKKKNY